MSAMNPEAFIEVAVYLPTNEKLPTEAAIRTSIGRSYYAVHALTCAALRTVGIHPSNDHGRLQRQLADAFNKTQDKGFNEVASLIGSLMLARKVADYEFQPSNDWRDRLSSVGYASKQASVSKRACGILNGLITRHR